MFELPRFVIKAGEMIVEQGEIRRTTEGMTLHVRPSFDEEMAADIQQWFDDYTTVQFANYGVTDDDLSNRGRVVPTL